MSQIALFEGARAPKPAPAPSQMSQELALLLSHESTEWYTPALYIELAREALGAIDLDPASSELAQETVRASRFYTEAQDGLSQPWAGRIWLNPPYSKTQGRSNQEIWAQRLIREYEHGSVSEAILLVKASLGYNWFEAIWDHADSVCFARRLLAFIKPGSGQAGRAKLGSAFFYFGPRPERFKSVFSQIGRVYP